MRLLLVTDDGQRELEMPTGTKLKNVVVLAKANQQTVIQLVNGTVAHPETLLAEGDKVELQGVIYGG